MGQDGAGRSSGYGAGASVRYGVLMRNPNGGLDGKAQMLAATLLVILTVALTSAVWISVGRTPARPEPVQPTPPPTPAAEPVLDRAGLIRLAGLAASAAATGREPPAELALAAGRRFELRIPFACARPDFTVTRDAARKSIRLTARAVDWTGSPMLAGVGGDGIEAVEGFWLPRPWVLDETCLRRDPALRAAAAAIDGLSAAPEGKTGEADAAPPAASPGDRTIGLAMVHRAGESRALRRGGRPYETVQSLDRNPALGDADDFQLLLSGRVGNLGQGRTTVCRATSPDRRPVCLVVVDFERVAIVRPGQEQPIAEWRQ